MAVISRELAGRRVGLGGRRDRQANAPERRARRGSKWSAWRATFGSRSGPTRAGAIYLTSSEGVAQFAAALRSLSFEATRVGTTGFFPEIEQAVWSVERQPAARHRADARRAVRSVDGANIADARAPRNHRCDGVALGLVGIYGVLSYVLTQRTREIGIRMALGAQEAQVKRMLLGHVLGLVGVGVAFGWAARRC